VLALHNFRLAALNNSNYIYRSTDMMQGCADVVYRGL